MIVNVKLYFVCLDWRYTTFPVLVVEFQWSSVLSPFIWQAQRAGRLAEEAGLKNVRFQVMDALNMEQGAEIGDLWKLRGELLQETLGEIMMIIHLAYFSGNFSGTGTLLQSNPYGSLELKGFIVDFFHDIKVRSQWYSVESKVRKQHLRSGVGLWVRWAHAWQEKAPANLGKCTWSCIES